jgi:hypothetical protein
LILMLLRTHKLFYKGPKLVQAWIGWRRSTFCMVYFAHR